LKVEIGMAVRKIATLPNDVLRRKARKRTDFGSELQTLIDDMIETMHTAPGVGLAAPQVGVSERVIVIEYRDDENEDVPPKVYAVVNPEVTRRSKDTVIGTEGCLSIPGILGDVERYGAVTIQGQNRRGQSVTIKAQGWLARIFQHEIDHLDGVVFVDRAQRVWQPENPEETAAFD